ncbi:hypothetical protein ACW9HM_05130 [Nocardia gipuzkoensis]
MRYSQAARAAATLAITGAGLTVLATGVASAGDTESVYGRKNCQILADQYRAMGYNARCYNTHGDWFYVHYEKPRPGARPDSGSAGSS